MHILCLTYLATTSGMFYKFCFRRVFLSFFFFKVLMKNLKSIVAAFMVPYAACMYMDGWIQKDEYLDNEEMHNINVYLWNMFLYLIFEL